MLAEIEVEIEGPAPAVDDGEPKSDDAAGSPG